MSMLRVRGEQIAILSAYTMASFVRRLAMEIRKNFPEKCGKMSDEQIQQFLQGGIARAATFKIDTEGDITRFIGLMLRKGSEFEKLPELAWSHEILADNALPGTAKMDLIERRLARKEKRRG